MVKFLFLRHKNRKMIGFTRPIRALCAVSPLPPYRASLGMLLLWRDESEPRVVRGTGPGDPWAWGLGLLWLWGLGLGPGGALGPVFGGWGFSFFVSDYSGCVHFLNVPHINNRPLKTHSITCQMKTQPASWTTAAAIFFFTLRAPDQHPSWRLHQLVLRIQPSRISLWYLLLVH
jgi:hypothetical protein